MKSKFVFPRKKTGSVYKITNVLTGKCYIGLTIRPLKVRLQSHFSSAFRNNSQCKLHVAIRKYGKRNFKISLLKNCYDVNELAKQEIFFIKKYDTYKNGYNSNKGGSVGGSKGIPLFINGKWFTSVGSMLLHYRIANGLYKNRRRKGWSIEESVGIVKRDKVYRPIIFRGVTYGTTKQLCKNFNVKYCTYIDRLNRDYTIEQALGIEKLPYVNPASIPVEYKGKRYSCKKDLTDSYGLPQKSLDYHLNKGYSIEKAMDYLLNKTVKYKGNCYDSLKDLADAFDINISTLYSRIRRGKTIEQSMDVLAFKPLI